MRTAPARGGRPSVPAAGAVVAVLALVALVLAGSLPHASTGETLSSTARRTPVGRDLVCLGGLPGVRWRAGTVVAGGTSGAADLLANGAPLQRGGSAPLRRPVTVHAAASAAAGAWAVQWSAARRSVAATSCPSPRAEWWFPGAGAATRHRGVLTLSNPREGDAIVDVTVLGPQGPIDAPGLRGIRVASGRTVRLDLATVSAAYGDLAVHVSATRGLVAAALPERFSAAVLAPTVRDWVTAQPDTARHSTVLGLGGRGSTATLLVANPSSREAVVSLRLLTEGGVVAPKDRPTLTVPPGRVAAVAFRDAVAAHAVGVRLSSQVPVSATVRSVQGRDEAYGVAAVPFGAAGVVGLPEGVAGDVRVVLAGPRAAGVQVTAYDGTGRVLDTRRADVPARGAVTVPVPRGAAAVRLTAPASSGVRAAVRLSSDAGLAVEAVPAASTDAEVPVVVPLAP
ncbi:MAG: DUF5719 family protein [Marmoricola sp.]